MFDRYRNKLTTFIRTRDSYPLAADGGTDGSDFWSLENKKRKR